MARESEFRFLHCPGLDATNNAAERAINGLLDALGDPTYEQHDELRDWIGDDYDPDAFSIENVTECSRHQASPGQHFTRLGAGTVNKY